MLDIFFIAIVYILSVVLISEFVRAKIGNQGGTFSILIYHYHVLIGFYYGWFAYGTDTSFYWNIGDRFRIFHYESWFDLFGTHNYFVFFINYPFSKVLELSFWTGTFLYSSISAWAFILLYLTGSKLLKCTNIKLMGFSVWPYLLFLPSLHFWSSGIGKDSLTFLAMALIFYGMSDLRKHLLPAIIGILCLYYVRPHMAFILLFSASLMMLLDSKLHFSYKIIFVAISTIGFYLIYDQVLDFLKIDQLDQESIETKFVVTTGNLSYGHSFVDMSSYPYPLKLFTFWYRPLFFDAHNLSSIINSFENLVCLIFTVSILANTNFLKRYKASPISLKVMFLAFLVSSIAFAGALSNFGIIVRMKNITFVYWLLLLVYMHDGVLFDKYQHLLKRYRRRERKHVSSSK